MNYFVLMMLNVLKQRSSDKNIVSHQIGVGMHEHELAIENNLQKGDTNWYVFFFELQRNSQV